MEQILQGFILQGSCQTQDATIDESSSSSSSNSRESCVSDLCTINSKRFRTWLFRFKATLIMTPSSVMISFPLGIGHRGRRGRVLWTKPKTMASSNSRESCVSDLDTLCLKGVKTWSFHFKGKLTIPPTPSPWSVSHWEPGGRGCGQSKTKSEGWRKLKRKPYFRYGRAKFQKIHFWLFHLQFCGGAERAAWMIWGN